MYDLNKKIIFTHPPKCAGTTIEDIFGWRPTPEQATAEELAFYRKHRHSSLESHINNVQELKIDPSVFFKFSCIRNPWDRAVSFFYHDKNAELYRFKKSNPDSDLPLLLKIAETGTFEDYLNFRYKEYKNGSNFLEIDTFVNYKKTYALDYVVRFENLQENILFLKQAYSIDRITLHYDQNSKRPKHKKYKDYYVNNKMIDMVEEMSATTIELFNYSF
jgi:chondroitin 4-sulfotransferase 11